MEPQLVALLNQTVTIAAPASADVYGKPSYATGVSYAARVSPGGVRLYQDQQGKSVPVTAYVYMDGDVPCTTRHRITLPDGATPVILTVDKPVDDDGTVHHTRVVCG